MITNVPHTGLIPKRFISGNPFNSVYKTMLGEVIGTNSNNGTVDLLINSARVYGVPVGTDSDYKKDGDFESGRTRLPGIGAQCVVAFLGGQQCSPFVIKVLPRRGSSLFNGEADRDADIHVSGSYRKTGTAGNFERVTNDGTFILITDQATSAVFPNTPPNTGDLSENVLTKIQVASAKRFIVSHPSGTWVEIDPDGNVFIVTEGDLKGKINGTIEVEATGAIKVKSTVSVEIEAPQTTVKGNLKVEGNIETDGAVPTHSHTITSLPVTGAQGSETVSGATDDRADPGTL